MTESDRTLIKDVYGIVARNLRKQGHALRFGSNLVLSSIPDEDGLFDPDDLEGLSCREFVFACYMRLLGRIPERTLNAYPTPGDAIPLGRDKEYDAQVLPTFLNSMEFRIVHGIEDPPPPPPPLPPPPPPPPPQSSMGGRVSRFFRKALKPITPLFIRKVLNSAFRHD